MKERVEACECDAMKKRVEGLKGNLKKSAKVNSVLRKQLKNVRKQIQKLRAKCMGKKKAVLKLKNDNVSLKNDILRFDAKESKCMNGLKGKKNTVYSDCVRQVVLALLCQADVAAGNVAKCIKIVSECLFNYNIDLSSLPCKQSVINIMYEGLAISNYQVVENALSRNDVTLHSDGTSRDHKKIVNHQITLDNGETYFLGFIPVCSEDASTLLEVTINLLKRLTKCFCDLSTDLEFQDSDHIFKTVLSKITSTMTDRAAAMKLFASKFKDFVKSELGCDVRVHVLNCNAHFLLGLSSACEKAAMSAETEITSSVGHVFGRDQHSQFKQYSKTQESAASRVIRITCDILGPRGDQKMVIAKSGVPFAVGGLLSRVLNLID